MPIRSHLTFRAPRWLNATRWICALVGIACAVLGGVEGLLAGMVMLQAGEGLEMYYEKRFWKRQAESIMGGEIARILHSANRDLLRIKEG